MRNNSPRIVARIQIESASNIVLCSVVLGELLYGVERSDPIHRPRTAAILQQLRERFVSLPFDDDAAGIYGVIRADLTGRGLIIGGNDMMIAATAMAHGLTLVTHNISEFGRIPGLMLEDWQ